MYIYNIEHIYIYNTHTYIFKMQTAYLVSQFRDRFHIAANPVVLPFLASFNYVPQYWAAPIFQRRLPCKLN